MPLSANTFERVLLACVSSGSDRRDTTRTATSINVPMYRDHAGKRDEITAQVTNVSAEGMGFVTETALEVGESLLVELPAASEHQQHLRLITQVRHCRSMPDGTFAIGSRFTTDAEQS